MDRSGSAVTGMENHPHINSLLQNIKLGICDVDLQKGFEGNTAQGLSTNCAFVQMYKPAFATKGKSITTENTEDAESMEPDSFQRFTARWWEAAHMNWNLGNSNHIQQGNFFPFFFSPPFYYIVPQGWSNARTVCPKRLWDLHPWRFSRLSWRSPWATCSIWLALCSWLDWMAFEDLSNYIPFWPNCALKIT